MTRNVQAPEIERPKDDPLSESIERHPAYAVIGAARWTGGNTYLYGSDFRHNAGITLTISRSELHRGLSHDWPSGREELISIDLSEAQWATFISTLNSGDTQCTLRNIHTAGQYVVVPGIERPTDRERQFKLEANDALKEIGEAATKLAALIESGGRKTEMRDLARGIVQGLSSHSGVSFIAGQFGEYMEEVTEKAKIEVSAYAEATLRRAGIEALADRRSPIELPPAAEKKP